MKITDIYESTTAGAVATVAQPMNGGAQKRNGVGKGVYRNEKPGTLLTGKKTNKPYANSVNEGEDAAFKQGRNHGLKGINDNKYINKRGKEKESAAYIDGRKEGLRLYKEKEGIAEGKMKQVASDLETMSDGNFQQKYKKSKQKMTSLLGTPTSMQPKSKNEINESVFDKMGKQNRQRLLAYADAFRFLEVLEKAGVNIIEVRPGSQTTARFLIGINDRQHLLTMNKMGEQHQANGVFNEAHLDEEDKIIAPGKGTKRKTGLHGKDEEQKLGSFKHPFKSSNVRVSDSRGNKVCECENEDLAKEVAKALNDYVKTDEGIVDKIKGAVRREKAKDMPLVQTRRDYAVNKAGDAFNKGETRKGAQYSAWAERDRKKMGHTTTNPAGTYRTKTTDYTNEAQSMKGALKNSLAKAEPGSKLDNSIKSHNGNIKAGGKGTLKSAPTGYHFDKNGYCRLGDK